jgi:threonine aldolase
MTGSLGPPPAASFASDNAAGAHPAVLDALAAANRGAALAYGDDDWTRRAAAAFRELFAAPVEPFLTFGGTGANVVALQCLLAPHEAVICPAGAHIDVDECGAPERFTGAKLIDVPAPDGKLTAEAVEPLLANLHGEHHVQPRVLAISQATELGTVYSVAEIAALGAFAREHGLLLFVDGARIANAAAALGQSAKAMLVETGVDVMTFGGTKNGMVFGEAVVFLRPELAARARFARKQAAQLASKMRFIAAQFEALLAGGRWLDLAAQANAMAARLAAGAAGIEGVRVVAPPAVNSVFVELDPGLAKRLQAWSFFWTWDASRNLYRWMTSFATTETDVDRFLAGVRATAAAARRR